MIPASAPLPGWLELRRADTLVPSRWRNGAGSTVELFRGENAANGEAPDWRFSVASIDAEAAYSDFSGYQRGQVLLSGGPLELQHADGSPFARLDAPGSRLDFPGDLALTARPQSPCRMGNVFARAPDWQMEVWLRPLLGNMLLPASQEGAWMGQLIGGQLRLRCGDLSSPLLHRDDAFLCTAQARPWVVLEGSGLLLLAQLRRAGATADQLLLEPVAPRV